MFSSQIQSGIFVDNLEEYITEEILWALLQKHNFEGLQQIKLPRERETQKLKGYAFIGFTSKESAIAAKKVLNQEVLYQNQLRVAMIGKGDPNANILISNISDRVTAKEFDIHFSKWGVVMSSKLGLTPNGMSQGYGYVQFETVQEATKCVEDCNTGTEMLGDKALQAVVFKDYPGVENMRKNLYLKEYRRDIQLDLLNNQDYLRSEKLKIEEELKTYLQVFGKVLSILIDFSKDFKKPFAFVCFENNEDATKALEHLSQDEKFMFSYKGWSKTKAELQQERENNADKKYIYIKNLRRDVTAEQLRDLLQVKCPVVSLIIKTPFSSKYDTNYATCILDKDDKLMDLKHWAQDLGSDLHKMFKAGQKPFISRLHHKKYHTSYIQNQYQYRLMGFKMNPPMNMNVPPNMQQMSQPNFVMPFQYFQQQMPMMMPPMMMNMNPMFMPMPGMHFPMGAPGQQQGGFMPQQRNRYQNQNNRGGGGFRPQQQRQYGQQYQNNGGMPRPQQAPRQVNFQQGKGPVPVNAPGLVPQGLPVQHKQGPPQMNPPQGLGFPPGQTPMEAQQAQQVQPPVYTFEYMKDHVNELEQLDQGKLRQILGAQIYPRVLQQCGNKELAPKITGMLIDVNVFSVSEIIEFVTDPEDFESRVQEAQELLQKE